MWRLTKRRVGGLAVLLVFAGHAYGQEATDGVSVPVRRASAQPPEGQGESAGDSGVTSGFFGIFTEGRLQVHVNGAYQAASRLDQTEVSFPTYGERTQLLTEEQFGGGAHVDVGGTLRIWEGLLLGASFTQVSRSGSAAVTGTVPHPLHVAQDRPVTEPAVGLPRRERAAHAYLGWRLTLSNVLEMDVLAGGTYFNLRRGVVHLTPFEVSGPPFSDVGLQIDIGEHTRNGAGFNAGIDLTYMLTSAARIPRVGIGFFARFTSGTVSIPVSADTSRSVSVGGVQSGVGLRFRF
jgi:hypothetical protein